MNETIRETPIALPERVLTPVSRALRLRFPGGAGALVWRRPFGVEIQERGLSRFVRVPDPTRKMQIGLLATGLTAVVFLRLLRSGRMRRCRIFGGHR
jgi:hypothetical protein